MRTHDNRCTRAEGVDWHAIRGAMPEPRHGVLAQISLLLAGSVDIAGRPWASVLAGRPGFISAPDPRTLRIAAMPLFGDPLGTTLAVGAAVGLLGIELRTRLGTHVNGTVAALDGDGFEVAVSRSIGQGPQDGAPCSFTLTPSVNRPDDDWPLAQFDTLDCHARDLIGSAASLCIATSTDGDAGPDVAVTLYSGAPGCVRIADPRTLVVPDIAGNPCGDASGNPRHDERAGLLFVDFASGDLVYLTGTTALAGKGKDARGVAVGRRPLRFHLTEGRRVTASLPLRRSTAA